MATRLRLGLPMTGCLTTLCFPPIWWWSACIEAGSLVCHAQKLAQPTFLSHLLAFLNLCFCQLIFHALDAQNPFLAQLCGETITFAVSAFVSILVFDVTQLQTRLCFEYFCP